MPDGIQQYLIAKLQQRVLQENKRTLSINGEGIDFFSNDYLGLSKLLMQPANHIYSYGSTGSRLLSGNYTAITELEQFLANFHEAETALIFNSGYDANLGLFSSLPDRHATILYDEYCHASIIDGIRLSQAKYAFRFRHNDLEDLEKKLSRHREGALFIAIESVYSMEGDMAPLAEIAALAEKYHAGLIVDEAHATGVFGVKGEGLVQQWGLQEKVLARVHTFGKAMGCHGAIVAGSNNLKEYLVNFARSFIYTTALPEHAVAMIRQAYRHLAEHSELIQQLQQRIYYFKSTCIGLPQASWMESNSPIQSLVTGSPSSVKGLRAFLKKNGLLVSGIMHPTVPKGTERIRICLHAFNTTEEIDLLQQNISNYLCNE